MREQKKSSNICAGTVLYEPNIVYLKRLISHINGIDLVFFVNGSIDDEVRDLLVKSHVYIQESSVNLGLGVGLNAISEYAYQQGYSHIFLLDQDSEPTSDLILSLLERAHKFKHLAPAIVAPMLLPPAEESYKPIRYAWRDKSEKPDFCPVDFAPTSGSLLDLEAFVEVGPFRDDFFIDGIDVEWGFRAWRLGRGSYLAKDMSMPHRWGNPREKQNTPQILRQSNIRNYYYIRNLIYTARLAHIPFIWRVKSYIRLFTQISVLAFQGSPGALQPVFRAFVDAFTGRLGQAPFIDAWRR